MLNYTKWKKFRGLTKEYYWPEPKPTVFTLTGQVSTLTGRLQAAFFDYYGLGQIVVA